MKINLHTHHPCSNAKDVLSIVNCYPTDNSFNFPFYSIGIHPWFIDEKNIEKHLNQLRNHLNFTNCLALGECGLDKKIDISMECQKKVFIAQLLLAEEFKKPVILHCVSAFQEILEIKKVYKIKVPMLIHGFSKKLELAKSLIQHGFYLSFGKHLLVNNQLEEVLKSVPVSRIFLETDASEISIENIYNKAEEILKVNIQEQIEENFKNIFGVEAVV